MFTPVRVGEWIRIGNKYIIDQDGYFWYQGCSDDMLKAGWIWASPVRIEATLMLHPSVFEDAVIGLMDKDESIKPRAHVILKQGSAGTPELDVQHKAFAKVKVAAYKYPRWIELANELPKTVTDKIQRFRLRRREVEAKGT